LNNLLKKGGGIVYSLVIRQFSRNSKTHSLFKYDYVHAN